jgi:16S rRNA (cytosine967-C5)-methyltransferase
VSAPGHAARAAAASLVAGVLEGGRSLADQSGAPSLAELTGPERARALGLAAGVLRHLGRIDAVLAAHLRKPPPAPARNALRLAVAELFLDAVPPHAAVDGAVRLAQAHPRARHLAGLVNAVARRVSEAPAAWTRAPEAGLPDWLERPVRAAWGAATAAAVRAAHLRPAPLDLTLRDPAVAGEWAAALGAEVLPTGGLRRPAGVQVSALPGFAEGAWWVQDAGAALPARMLGDVSGLRALDLCAAPGGKTLQLAAAGADVTALDASRARLRRLDENLARTGLTARVVAADALRWEPEAEFDAILVDAPCSASGTIRRHPDLPHLRRDLGPLLAQQAALLARAWDWLAPGGRLVYATCSLLPAEGEAQVAAFVADRPDAERIPCDAPALGVEPEWIDADGALRLRPDFWPERGGVDGFYAAALRKRGDRDAASTDASRAPGDSARAAP